MYSNSHPKNKHTPQLKQTKFQLKSGFELGVYYKSGKILFFDIARNSNTTVSVFSEMVSRKNMLL